MNGSQPATSLTLPATEFYWGVFPSSAETPWPRDLRRASARAALDHEFQKFLPLSIDDAVPAYTRSTDQRVIACALPLARVRELLAAEPGLLQLGPAAIPAEFEAQVIDLSELNLLTGPYEPAPVRASREKRTLRLQLAAGAGLLLLALGLGRRAAHKAAQTEAILLDTTSAVQQLTGRSGSLDEVEPVLRHERQRLVATRSAHAARNLPADAAQGLLAVLRVWPGNIDVRTQSLSASAQGVTVGAEVATQDAARDLTHALGQADGWTLQTPRTHASGKSVRVDATLQKRSGP